MSDPDEGTPASALVAFEIMPANGMELLPASSSRDWMDESRDRFAYRCLPLVIANQAGWVVTCPRRFSATWNGGPWPADVALRFGRAKPDARIMAHFGEGVVTFWMPYLFRTPPGVNLWVKGPSNMIKDGAQPLEGVVETDWTSSTFTMNWKLTRPKHAVTFEAGEPICMIVPVARGFAEGFAPALRPLASDPEVAERFHAWSRSRAAFLEKLDQRDPEATRRAWEKDYMKGTKQDGQAFREHQTRLQIRPFERK